MLEITNIEYKEERPTAEDGGKRPYRCLLFHVRLPDGTPFRFLVDEQSIRMLNGPGSKGLISRKNVARIVVVRNSDKAFSVFVYIRQGLADRTRSHLLGLVQGETLTYPEEIGTSFDRFDHAQVGEWLKSLGYVVEYPAVQPA